MSNCAIMDFAIFSTVAHQKHEGRDMKNKIDTSRSKTPWDNSKQLSSTQSFIKKKYKANYKNKHPKLSKTNEASLINSISVDKCPYCGKSDLKKYGKTSNGIQRFACLECHKTFTPITNTIFDDHKISITEWVEYCLDILNYGSTTLSSKVNKNAINTSNYWLHKLFLVLRDYQKDIKLKGNIYIDETFYSIIYREHSKKMANF